MDKLTEKVAKAIQGADAFSTVDPGDYYAMARAALRFLRREKCQDTVRIDWLNHRCRDVYADRASNKERWILAGDGHRWHPYLRHAIDAAMRAERKARGGRS